MTVARIDTRSRLRELLIVGSNEVWDQTPHMVVTFPQYLDAGQVPDSGILSFNGGNLAVAQGSDGRETVLVIKSGTLPTSPGG